MQFELTVLGANSATPMPGRFPSSFILNHDSLLFLIDCGEGAQIKMSEFGVKRSKIDHVFISHLHGDHIFGLPGFINSFNLNSRTKPLHLIGPAGIQAFVQNFIDVTEAVLGFDLEFSEIQGDHYRKVLDLPLLEVFTFPLKHRIPTYGYKFKEKKRQRNVDPDAIDRWKLTVEELKGIKKGDKVFREDVQIPSDQLFLPVKERRSFVYCSDTVYTTSILPFVQGCDLLYHEATYMHDLKDKAHLRMHSTTVEAATIAKNGGIGQLLIGHYSSRYKDLEKMKVEAQSVFENTQVAQEGRTYPI